MSKKIYIAYGSNLNLNQMGSRCPTAKLYGVGTINGYELQFKGAPECAFATIEEKNNSSVPVAVWELQNRDEHRLDIYEGYPNHYYKKDIAVTVNDEELTAMVYIMNPKMDYGMPSSYYYEVVKQGYEDCGLDTSVLEQALKDSTAKYLESQDDETEDEGVSFGAMGM